MGDRLSLAEERGKIAEIQASNQATQAQFAMQEHAKVVALATATDQRAVAAELQVKVSEDRVSAVERHSAAVEAELQALKVRFAETLARAESAESRLQAMESWAGKLRQELGFSINLCQVDGYRQRIDRLLPNDTMQGLLERVA